MSASTSTSTGPAMTLIVSQLPVAIVYDHGSSNECGRTEVRGAHSHVVHSRNRETHDEGARAAAPVAERSYSS